MGGLIVEFYSKQPGEQFGSLMVIVRGRVNFSNAQDLRSHLTNADWLEVDTDHVEMFNIRCEDIRGFMVIA